MKDYFFQFCFIIEQNSQQSLLPELKSRMYKQSDTFLEPGCSGIHFYHCFKQGYPLVNFIRISTLLEIFADTLNGMTFDFTQHFAIIRHKKILGFTEKTEQVTGIMRNSKIINY